MREIVLKKEGDNIIISGEIDFLKRSNYKSWFNNKFQTHTIEEDRIILVLSQNSDSEKTISYTIEYLKKKNKNHTIIYDKNIKDVINDKVLQEEKFRLFTREAKLIREDNYQSLELEHFCNVLTDTLPNRRLFKLQALSAYHLAFSQNSCNFSVPGAGKTSIVYAAFSYLNNLGKSSNKYVNKIVVVGPLSSFEPWEDEYYECFGRKAKSFRFSSANSIDDKRNVLKGITSASYDLYLFSYQSLPTLKEELSSFMKNPENAVLFVCDEAHKFKNVEGIWARTVLSLAQHASSRVVLTGTPAPNGYEDLYNLFKFIYPQKNVMDYNQHYLKQLSERPILTEIDALIENIKPFFVRIKKSDLNLPDFQDIKITNELNLIEREIYNKLEKALSDEVFEGNKNTIFFRLIQASLNLNLLTKNIPNENDVLYFNEEVTITIPQILGVELYNKLLLSLPTYIPSKFNKTLEIVRSLNEKGEKVLIWGYFTDSIKRLDKYLKGNGLNGNYVIGETNQSSVISDKVEFTRKSIVSDFKKGDLDYLISNPMVLGESISLHKICHNAIYFERSYSAAPYIQSRDRIHRVWLDDNYNQIIYDTTYYHIISNTAADEKIIERIDAKFTRMVEIIEDDIPLYKEDLEDERKKLISKIISNYRFKNNG